MVETSHTNVKIVMGLSAVKALPGANSFFRSSNAQKSIDRTQRKFWLNVLLRSCLRKKGRAEIK
jgi:hypothetical protein